MEGIGEGIGAAITFLTICALVQIPFALIGMWVTCCWVIQFVGQHWR